MSKHLYIFSGLGADARVFRKLDFGDLMVHHIEWLDPLPKETLQQYAYRISKEIKTENPIIIGLSFGGMLSIEVCKFLSYEKLILISTAKTYHELRAVYRYLGKLHLHNMIPVSVIRKLTFILNPLFGANTKHDKSMLKNILDDTNPKFLIWALNEILKWKNTEHPKRYIHLHGDRDNILPLGNITCNYVIRKGGHLMTLSHPQQISEIIKKELGM